MFDYEEVGAAASSLTGSVRADRIAELQQRVHQMQGTALSQPVPTLPALQPLLTLRTGASYAVDSPALAMALMAGPSAAGWWSAVVGLPELGIEAAAALGVALERTVLVPDPGAAWLNVVATLAEVLPVVVTRPPAAVGQHDAARLTARLRQRGAVLIALGDWPRADARLRVVRSRWSGIGAGHGHLAGRVL
ncbi:hypothetical protein, partial [Desertihabitans aurantiacus]|uniref:hypothetical protein n=1 Tax=Desertihabitans aurantiacus TaxID=2282477 RepID=UPI0018E57248